MDDLQLHQVASCPAIEKGFCDPKESEIKVVFRWMTETTVTDCVHIILSDVDSQIELKNVSYERYESDLISIVPGRYYGQILVKDEIKPLKAINISSSTIYVEIEVENEGGLGQLVVANHNQILNEKQGSTANASKELVKFEPSQLQLKGTAASDIASKGVQVNYELNKKLALSKKMVSCGKEDIVVKHKVTACRIELNTGSFEYFREDIIERMKNSPCYKLGRFDEVKDLSGNVTGAYQATILQPTCLL